MCRSRPCRVLQVRLPGAVGVAATTTSTSSSGELGRAGGVDAKLEVGQEWFELLNPAVILAHE
jgi:hypothetical protein